MRGQKYVLQVAPEDCTGCNCASKFARRKTVRIQRLKPSNDVAPGTCRRRENQLRFLPQLPEIDRSKLERIDIRTSQLIHRCLNIPVLAPVVARRRILIADSALWRPDVDR